mmetsp:Transcript_10596/g.27459  ORF Transcript_10596/g.27459 Transcript_10596/m.27459 type:complete len:322 (+) Transcript_10596:104-1069(+)
MPTLALADIPPRKRRVSELLELRRLRTRGVALGDSAGEAAGDASLEANGEGNGDANDEATGVAVDEDGGVERRELCSSKGVSGTACPTDAALSSTTRVAELTSPALTKRSSSSSPAAVPKRARVRPGAMRWRSLRSMHTRAFPASGLNVRYAEASAASRTERWPGTPARMHGNEPRLVVSSGGRARRSTSACVERARMSRHCDDRLSHGIDASIRSTSSSASTSTSSAPSFSAGNEASKTSLRNSPVPPLSSAWSGVERSPFSSISSTICAAESRIEVLADPSSSSGVACSTSWRSRKRQSSSASAAEWPSRRTSKVDSFA